MASTSMFDRSEPLCVIIVLILQSAVSTPLVTSGLLSYKRCL